MFSKVAPKCYRGHNLLESDPCTSPKKVAVVTHELLTRINDDVLVVYFQDVRIVDESRIESLGRELMNQIGEATNDKMIVNFQNVAFMSSAMIGKLILFGKKCSSSNVKLRVCGVNENIRQVFALMHLDKIFEIDPDEKTAIEKLSKKSWFKK
ncbi:MAG: STAS domain-containing protein [Pirellulaceae bacterium]